MSMSLKNQQALLRDGFLQSEVTEFAEAVAPDGYTPQHINIESKTWLQARENRANWIKMLQNHCQEKLGRRLSQTDINKLVVDWRAQDSSRTPWDLIKSSYRPPKMLGDYAEAKQRRAQNKTSKLYRKRTIKTRKKSNKYATGKPHG